MEKDKERQSIRTGVKLLFCLLVSGFVFLVYFEDGIPDDYRYCLSLEGEHMIYHKFTPEDYEDFGF